MILTLQQLIDAGACRAALRSFERRFGKSVEVTLELCETECSGPNPSVFTFTWQHIDRLLLRSSRRAYWRARKASFRDYLEALRPLYGAPVRSWQGCHAALNAYRLECARLFAFFYNQYPDNQGASMNNYTGHDPVLSDLATHMGQLDRDDRRDAWEERRAAELFDNMEDQCVAGEGDWFDAFWDWARAGNNVLFRDTVAALLSGDIDRLASARTDLHSIMLDWCERESVRVAREEWANHDPSLDV